MHPPSVHILQACSAPWSGGLLPCNNCLTHVAALVLETAGQLATGHACKRALVPDKRDMFLIVTCTFDAIASSVPLACNTADCMVSSTWNGVTRDRPYSRHATVKPHTRLSREWVATSFTSEATTLVVCEAPTTAGRYHTCAQVARHCALLQLELGQQQPACGICHAWEEGVKWGSKFQIPQELLQGTCP